MPTGAWQLVGGVSIGVFGVSAGGSVAITNVGTATKAFIDDNARVRRRRCHGQCAFTDNLKSRAYGGSASLGVGLGAQVSIINDNSSQLAYTDDGTANGNGAKIVKGRPDREGQANRTISAEAKGRPSARSRRRRRR